MIFTITCVDSIQNQLWWKLILDLAVDDFHNKTLKFFLSEADCYVLLFEAECYVP
jgi:hypothetical protein